MSKEKSAIDKLSRNCINSRYENNVAGTYKSFAPEQKIKEEKKNATQPHQLNYCKESSYINLSQKRIKNKEKITKEGKKAPQRLEHVFQNYNNYRVSNYLKLSQITQLKENKKRRDRTERIPRNCLYSIPPQNKINSHKDYINLSIGKAGMAERSSRLAHDQFSSTGNEGSKFSACNDGNPSPSALNLVLKSDRNTKVKTFSQGAYKLFSLLSILTILSIFLIPFASAADPGHGAQTISAGTFELEELIVSMIAILVSIVIYRNNLNTKKENKKIKEKAGSQNQVTVPQSQVYNLKRLFKLFGMQSQDGRTRSLRLPVKQVTVPQSSGFESFSEEIPVPAHKPFSYMLLILLALSSIILIPVILSSPLVSSAANFTVSNKSSPTQTFFTVLGTSGNVGVGNTRQIRKLNVADNLRDLISIT